MPNEIIQQLMSFLPLSSLECLGTVSKEWRNLVALYLLEQEPSCYLHGTFRRMRRTEKVYTCSEFLALLSIFTNGRYLAIGYSPDHIHKYFLDNDNKVLMTCIFLHKEFSSWSNSSMPSFIA